MFTGELQLLQFSLSSPQTEFHSQHAACDSTKHNLALIRPETGWNSAKKVKEGPSLTDQRSSIDRLIVTIVISGRQSEF